MNKPLLVSGLHRSGNTWLANMLALSGETSLIEEPFNIENSRYALDGLAKFWYTYATELNQKKAIDAYKKIIEMKSSKLFRKRSPLKWFPFLRYGRPLIKDLISSLSVFFLTY